MRPLSLWERYEALCADQSLDIYEHLPTFVDTVVTLDAQRVIELGVRRGVSTIAWLYALEKTGGHLWSVDIDPPPALRLPMGAGWTFLHADDRLSTTLDQLPDGCDVLFIDTSHSFSHTLLELVRYVPLVRSGGVVFAHDTANEYPDDAPPTDPPFPVARALDVFTKVGGFEWTDTPTCFGLGRIDVP